MANEFSLKLCPPIMIARSQQESIDAVEIEKRIEIPKEGAAPHFTVDEDRGLETKVSEMQDRSYL
jgi:hypothetical protein